MKKTKNKKKRTCKRVHCPITYLRCSSRGSFCSFFTQKRGTHIWTSDRCIVHMRWRPFCGRELTSPDDKPFKEVRGCLVKSPPFPSTFLSFLCFSYSTHTGCSVEITVADTVGSLNLMYFSWFNFQCYEYLIWDTLKKKRRKAIIIQLLEKCNY